MSNARAIITRSEAKAAGLTQYFTGKPCNLGGVAARRVSSGTCLCEKHLAIKAKHRIGSYHEKRGELIASGEIVPRKRRSLQDKIEYQRQYREANKERIKSQVRDWCKLNPDKLLANTHRRRAAKMNATPDWDRELTDFVTAESADLAKRREAATGIKWEVDHVVPLQGEKVCGMHVWNNIAVIPQKINRAKSNFFEAA